MAYRIDENTGDIVIDGFQAGIADDPFDGISDLRNVDTLTVPGEVSVNFKTYRSSPLAATTTFTADATTNKITPAVTTNLGVYVSVTLTTTGTLPAPLATGTNYWLGSLSGGAMSIYTTPDLASPIDITTTGTGVHTLTVTTMGKPRYFNSTQTRPSFLANQVLLDTNGRAWIHATPAAGNVTTWVYLGNTQFPVVAETQGIVIYQTNNGAISYIFVFRDAAIDYLKCNSNPILSGIGNNWVYGWNPTTGGSGANSLNDNSSPHEALVGQDNVVYYCDGNYVGSFFEKTGSTFDPTTTSTYTWAKQALALPKWDVAICLAELGIRLMVGGFKNAIYPWDRTSTSFNYPILIADTNIVRMVTLNTNTYIFAGARGRIYITNGSQAQLYKKIPDHLSNTVQPYFTWGGATFIKNQLYCSFSVLTNGGTAITTMGGVWSIDVDNQTIRLVNKLSYGTYAGYASAMEPRLISSSETSNAGTGLLIGWSDGNGGTGADDSTAIDATGSAPYSNSEATIDSDLIPIGTFLKQKQFSQFEYKLTKPMVSGESVTLQYRLDFSQNYTTVMTDSTAGNFSSVSDGVNFAAAQWIQVRAILNSTATTPSYTRLKEIRIR